MTKKQSFETLLQNHPEFTAEERALIEKAIADIEKRNSYKRKTPTAKQVANEEIKAKILDFMAQDTSRTYTNETYTNETLRTQFDMSSQKMSALLAQLVEEGHLVAEDIKRKKHYTYKA